MTKAYGANTNDSWHSVLEYTLATGNEAYVISALKGGAQLTVDRANGSNLVGTAKMYNGSTLLNTYDATGSDISQGGSSYEQYDYDQWNAYTGAITVYRTHASQTVTLKEVVQLTAGTMWIGASSKPINGTSTATATITVPAKSSYAISFNANGGSGAPSSQTKWYGETLTLSSTIPTRSGYVFKEWNTDSSGAGTSYQPGEIYTSDSPVTLYAIWKAVPTLTILSAVRCDSSGNPREDMGYVKVTAAYESLYAITATSASVGSASKSGLTYSSGSGTITIIVGSGDLLPLSQYTVSLSATSEAGTSTVSGTLPPSSVYAMPTISNASISRTTSTTSTAVDAVGKYLRVQFTSNLYSESQTTTGIASVAFEGESAQTVPISSPTQVISKTSSQYAYADLAPGSSYPTACTIVVTDKFGYQATLTMSLGDDGYARPKASSMTAYRSTVSGTVDDEGTTATVRVNWSVTATPSQTAPKTFTVYAYDMNDILIAKKSLSPSSTSGVTTYTFRGTDRQDGLTSDDMFDTDSKYLIAVEIEDAYFSDYKADILSVAYFTMDVLAGGHGVAFGKPSTTAELLDVGYEIHSDVEVTALDSDDVTHKLTKKADKSDVDDLVTGVSGVKGNAETDYRTGDVNITPANIGAAEASHMHTSLPSLATISGSSQSAALKARFDNYKSTTPRNQLINYYSSAMSNGALAMGYFLSGYDSAPYGGFFVCHYNTPRYVGIAGGTYTDHLLITDRNYTAYCVPKRTVLYNNTTGTNGTVTLSASAANYNHMRIYYRVNRDSHVEYASVDSFSPNGKRHSLLLYRANSTSSTAVDLAGAVVSVSGTSITKAAYSLGQYNSGPAASTANANDIYIVRVEAWNE